MKHKFPALLAVAAAFALPVAAHATTFQFTADLAGANEVPAVATSASGIAVLFYNDFGTASFADDSVQFSLAAFGLSGAATDAHIHGLAAAGSNAPVLVNLTAAPFFASGGANTLLIGGSFSGVPDGSVLNALQSGLLYVNVHTALNPTGEIRGQLTQVAAVVPEPSTYALMLGGLGVVGMLMRRRTISAS